LWTTRNMQKLTCYTQDGPHSGSWAPPAYHCSVQLTCLLGVHLSLDCQISRAVSPKQKLKINQLENILNLIGQDLCNSIWLREGPETVRRPSLNIFFGARQADLNWSACVSEHHCLCEAIKAQKKNHTPSDFRPPTRDGGDCYENSPVGLFRLKLLILENILQLWRRECVSIESEFYSFLTSYGVGKMLSFCCLFQQSIVSSNCQLPLPVVTNDDENAALGGYKFST